MLNEIMRAHDAVKNKELGLTPETVKAWEEYERARANAGLTESNFWGCYVFDGEIIYSPQMARIKQYDADEMYSIYFRVRTGEILRIRKCKAGDF